MSGEVPVVATRDGGLGVAVAAAILAAAALGGCGPAEPKTPEERLKIASQTYKEGVSLYNEGKLDTGIEKLRESKKHQPDWTLMRRDLGIMLLDRALRNEATALQLRGEALEARDQKKEAEAADKDRRASDLEGQAHADFMEARDNFEFWYDKWPQPDERANSAWCLMRAYAGLGDFKRARDMLEEAIDAAQPSGPLRERLEKGLAFLKEAELRKERLGQR